MSFIVLITRVFSRIVSMTVTRRKPLAQSTRLAVVVAVVAAAAAAAVCLQNEVVISVLQPPLAPLSLLLHRHTTSHAFSRTSHRHNNP